MTRIDTAISEAKEIVEARIVPWEDIYMPLLSMKAFSMDDLDKVKKQLFAGPNSYNDTTPTGTADFLRVVERIFGRASKQFVQAHHLFRTKGWECVGEAETDDPTTWKFYGTPAEVVSDLRNNYGANDARIFNSATGRSGKGVSFTHKGKRYAAEQRNGEVWTVGPN